MIDNDLTSKASAPGGPVASVASDAGCDGEGSRSMGRFYRLMAMEAEAMAQAHTLHAEAIEAEPDRAGIAYSKSREERAAEYRAFATAEIANMVAYQRMADEEQADRERRAAA